MTPAQALALGAMVEDVEDEARIVTKAKLQTKFNGVARSNLITKSLDFFEFRPGKPGRQQPPSIQKPKKEEPS